MAQKRKLERSSKNDTISYKTKAEQSDASDVCVSDSDTDYEVDVKKPKKIKLERKITTIKTKIKKEACTVKVKKEIKSVFKKNGETVCNWLDHNLLAEKESISTKVAHSIIKLFETGNTIPFIARYRRDLIDNLPSDKLRNIKDSYEEICSLRIKAEKVLNSIEKSGKLTIDLHSAVANCKTHSELEHIYAPFKQKGIKSLAERAINLGLDKSALNILTGDVEVNLKQLVNIDKEGLRNLEEVETSLTHLVAHYLFSNKEVLDFIRDIKSSLNLRLETKLSASAKKIEKDEMHKFEQYFDYSIPVKYLKPHQTLAINRGETLKILSVKIIIPDFLFTKIKSFCEHKWLDDTNKTSTRIRIFQKSCDDSYKRYIVPLIRRQTMSDITSQAEKASTKVFAENLKNLLLAPPIKGKVIMGIDPGFQVGCKVAVISACGEMLQNTVIFPHTRNTKEKDEDVITNLLINYKCTLIALGNGKACRETEAWLTKLLKSKLLSSLDINYTIVDESGASIYSCSVEAKNEFQDLDPLVISAISLARRIQDPLAELVKIDPKSLGVGMYQHDLRKKDIENTLTEVVSECVSFVGVDLNTASHSLLKRVAGLTSQRADNILQHRALKGPFTNRYQLKDVKGIGDKVFEQCAGFLRVGPANAHAAKEFYAKPETMPLDCTWIHPESYDIAEKLMEKFGLFYKQIGEPNFIETFKKNLSKYTIINLANELNTTEATMKLICEVLSRPLDHDLRNENPQGPLFKKEVTSMEDIRVGINLTGRVTNVTHFGAFVDIGVGRCGLIHNTAMRGVHVQLGYRVEVNVIKIEKHRSRIGLELVRVL